MKRLIFSTGNALKFQTASDVCKKYDIALAQKDIDVVEIQDEDPRRVALDKAAKAFAVTGKPVVITDDSWSLEGLNGFPGVYMHSINEWFTPEDFLRLVLPLKNRKVTMTQYLVYTDGYNQKVFTQQSEGELLKEVRGQSKLSSYTVIAMTGDNGLSIAEAIAQAHDKSTRQTAQVWYDFVEWYSKN